MKDKIELLIKEYASNWNFDSFRDGKLVITFSAIPGAGKTTVAKQLQTKYNLARINRDDLHDIMVEMEEAHNEELLKAAVQKLTQTLADKGKVIVFDSSVDRKYDEIREWADKAGYSLLIIQIEAERELLEQRIRDRNKDGAADYLKEMDRWIKEHDAFVNRGLANLVINGNSDQELNELRLFLNL